jgi:molecular chaperone DnaK
MATIKAIGIDLGTTNSAVAGVNEAGRTEMIRNVEGDLLTPSVVLFEDTEVIVGKEAKNAATVKPDRVAQFVKRDMGMPVYSRPIRGEYLPPEVIQACILRKLKADAVRVLGPDIGAVITVPAYFDEPRRKATADAGEMAGLNVLDIVNEPTAAALGYSEITGYLNGPNGPQPEMNVLVYDLGGGTFDATLLRLSPGDIRTLATDGDVQLGGHDWDTRLLNYVAEAFVQLHGRDPRQDQAAFNRLYATIVDAKHTLSARSRASIRFDYQGCSGELAITREQFEEITADLLERTAYTSRQLLAAANLQWSDVSRVLLVGGSTRMPMVSRMLRGASGVDPDRTVNPDEAVARGAAIYAHHLLQKAASQPKFTVTNVNSHSLGIEGIDQGTLRKTNVVLIPRNTPLPAKFQENFVTKADNQQSIVIQVLEGESSIPSQCTAIGRTVIRDLPPGLPKGWPIEVTFEYAANGRLTVSATVPGTQRATVLAIERERGLSNEGIHGWKQAVTASGGFGGFSSQMNDQLRARGQEVQHSPLPSRQAWGDGYGYAGSQAALSQVSPTVQPPGSPTASDAGDIAQQAPAAPNQPPPVPPAGSIASGDLQTQANPAGNGENGGQAQDGQRHVKLLINIIGFALSSVLGLGAGYVLIRLFLPNTRLPWFW